MEKIPKNWAIRCSECKTHCKLTRRPQTFGIFLKITVLAFYVQNTLKTQNIWCDFSEKLGNLQILCTTNHKSNIIVVENSEKLGFPPKSKQFLAKYLLLYMWFYKGIKVNILATTQKIAVALIYKINPVQITTIIAENAKIH